MDESEQQKRFDALNTCITKDKKKHGKIFNAISKSCNKRSDEFYGKPVCEPELANCNMDDCPMIKQKA